MSSSMHNWSIREAFLRKSWSIFALFLKYSWRILEEFLKHSWSILDAFLKHFWSILEEILQHFCIILEVFLKYSWSILEAFLKHSWKRSSVTNGWSDKCTSCAAVAAKQKVLYTLLLPHIAALPVNITNQTFYLVWQLNNNPNSAKGVIH